MELKKVIAVRTAKTVYRDGDKAIKVFGDEYKKSDILNEALNQARVEETGIPMPKLIEVCKLDGKWAIVSDYIEGKTLQQLMDENPAKTEEYLDLFVDIQMSILAKTCPMLNKLKCRVKYLRPTLTQQHVMTFTHVLPVCIPITRFATVISDRVTLLSAMTA